MASHRFTADVLRFS